MTRTTATTASTRSVLPKVLLVALARAGL
jgi:hypothetical protein